MGVLVPIEGSVSGEGVSDPKQSRSSAAPWHFRDDYHHRMNYKCISFKMIFDHDNSKGEVIMIILSSMFTDKILLQYD